MRRENIFEEAFTEPLLKTGDQPGDFGQGGRQIVRAVEEPGELGRDPRLLAALQFEQHMLLGREVEVEGSVGDTRRGHDGGDLGAGHARPGELGDRRTQDALPRLTPARLARGRLELCRHDGISCSAFTDSSQ
jgi:hypothetical protein